MPAAFHSQCDNQKCPCNIPKMGSIHPLLTTYLVCESGAPTRWEFIRIKIDQFITFKNITTIALAPPRMVWSDWAIDSPIARRTVIWRNTELGENACFILPLPFICWWPGASSSTLWASPVNRKYYYSPRKETAKENKAPLNHTWLTPSKGTRVSQSLWFVTGVSQEPVNPTGLRKGPGFPWQDNQCKPGFTPSQRPEIFLATQMTAGLYFGDTPGCQLSPPFLLSYCLPWSLAKVWLSWDNCLLPFHSSVMGFLFPNPNSTPPLLQSISIFFLEGDHMHLPLLHEMPPPSGNLAHFWTLCFPCSILKLTFPPRFQAELFHP